MDRCTVPRCRAEAEVIYLDRGVCMTHWNRYTAEDAPPDKLRMVLGLEPDASTALEETMPETTPAAETAAKEEAMVTTKSKTESKGPKKAPTAKATKAKPAKKAKAPKEPKPQAEKLGRVFAIRVTDDELAAIHRASGPRNATRFIRQVAAAFAAEDDAAFKEVVKEAREARQ